MVSADKMEEEYQEVVRSFVASAGVPVSPDRASEICNSLLALATARLGTSDIDKIAIELSTDVLAWHAAN